MSYAVASGALVDAFLDGLHNCLGFRLCLLSLAGELDFVKGDESTADATCLAEIVEGVLKLCKPKFLLATDNAS